MSEPAAEMPISDAREHLADVVNRAVYGGEPTYLTRRGRRMALVVSPAQLAADQARAAEHAVADACRVMWQDVAGADEPTRTAVRNLIGKTIAAAEDLADIAAVAAAEADHQAGAEPIPWEQVKSELGL